MEKLMFKKKVKSLMLKQFSIKENLNVKLKNQYIKPKTKYLNQFNRLFEKHILNHLDNTYNVEFSPRSTKISKINPTDNTLTLIAEISLSSTTHLNPPFDKIKIKIYNTEYSLEKETQKLIILSKITKSILTNQSKIVLNANRLYKKLKNLEEKHNLIKEKSLKSFLLSESKIQKLAYEFHLPKLKSLEEITLFKFINIDVGSHLIENVISIKLTQSHKVILTTKVKESKDKDLNYTITPPNFEEFLYNFISKYHFLFTYDSTFREAKNETLKDFHKNLAPVE